MSQHASSATRADVDHKLNIVVFGITENHDGNEWCMAVADFLRFLIDRDVDVTDMFHLGRFSADNTRPILVKLCVAWDKWLILSRCFTLKN